jgi:hypothetical protein
MLGKSRKLPENTRKPNERKEKEEKEKEAVWLDQKQHIIPMVLTLTSSSCSKPPPSSK